MPSQSILSSGERRILGASNQIVLPLSCRERVGVRGEPYGHVVLGTLIAAARGCLQHLQEVGVLTVHGLIQVAAVARQRQIEAEDN